MRKIRCDRTVTYNVSGNLGSELGFSSSLVRAVIIFSHVCIGIASSTDKTSQTAVTFTESPTPKLLITAMMYCCPEIIELGEL